MTTEQIQALIEEVAVIRNMEKGDQVIAAASILDDLATSLSGVAQTPLTIDTAQTLIGDMQFLRNVSEEDRSLAVLGLLRRLAPVLGGGGTEVTDFTFSNATYGGRLHAVITGVGTNAAVALIPSGTGPFQLHVADGTAAGGNIRGNNSVDLQMVRTAASQVASGSNSFTAGRRCTASGARSVAMGNECSASGSDSIALGDGATASGDYSFCGSDYATASGAYSFAFGSSAIASGISSYVISEQSSATAGWACVFGGRQGLASGQHSSVLGGRGNQATASYAAVCGGQDNLASGQYSFVTGYGAVAPSTFMRAHGFQGNGPVGGFQRVDVGFYNQTINATPTRLFVNGGAENYIIPANSIVQMTIRINATRNTAGAEFAAYERRVTFKRGVAVGTVALVGSPQTIGTDVGSNTGIPPAAWSIAITEDVATGGINITVTGEAAKTIRWTAVIDAVETVFA